MNQSNVKGLGEAPQADSGEVVDALLAEYIGPTTSLERAFRDETEALLAAVLLELRGDKSIPDATVNKTDEGTYSAFTVEVNEDGPVDQDQPNVDGQKIDLGAIWDRINLRFTDQIRIAFKSDDDQTRTITYDADDSPVTGLAVETQYIWLKRGPDATTNPEVQIEAGAPAASVGDGTREEQEKTNARLGNWDTLDGFTYSTTSTNVEALPSHDVPDGVTVLVTYGRGNAGDVYVGTTDVQPATLSADAHSFAANVTDTAEVHVRTPNAGDSVGVLFER